MKQNTRKSIKQKFEEKKVKNKTNVAIIISNQNSLVITVLKSLKMQTQNSIEEKIEDKPIISMENNIKAKTK